MAWDFAFPGALIPGMYSTADLSAATNQFLCVNSTAAGKVKVQATKGSRVLGILQNTPKAGAEAVVQGYGISKGRVTAGTHVAINSGDKVICSSGGGIRGSTGTTTSHYVLGIALEALGANTTGIIPVFITHSGSGSTGAAA